MVRIRSILILTTGAAGAAAVLVASPGTYEWLRRATGRVSDRHHYETELAEHEYADARARRPSRRTRPTTCACRCGRGSRRAPATSRRRTPTRRSPRAWPRTSTRSPPPGPGCARRRARRAPRSQTPSSGSSAAQTAPGERSTAVVAASCARVDVHVARHVGRILAARQAALEQGGAAPAALAEADQLAAVRIDHLVRREAGVAGDAGGCPAVVGQRAGLGDRHQPALDAERGRARRSTPGRGTGTTP